MKGAIFYLIFMSTFSVYNDLAIQNPMRKYFFHEMMPLYQVSEEP